MENVIRMTTGLVRLSYAHIWEPRAMEGQEPKYSACILIPKDDFETLEAIEKSVAAAKVKDAGKCGGKIPLNLKTPLRDGDAERPEDPNYAGHYFLNASRKLAPAIVEPFKVNGFLKPITDETRVYSGCYVRVSLNFFGYNSSGNRGIGAGLGNIQFIKDGDRLSGGSRPDSDFTEWKHEESSLLD